MKKTLSRLLLSSAIMVGSCQLAFAGGIDIQPAHPVDNHHFGISLFYDELVDDFGIGLDGKFPYFELGINGSVDHNSTADNLHFTEWYLGAYLGYRHIISGDVYGSIGAQGNYQFLSGSYREAGFIKNQYTVGPYVGLAYQPNPHVQVFVRVMPYSFERNSVNDKEHEFFQEGQVGLKYFF